MDQLTAAGKQIRNPQILYNGSLSQNNSSIPDFTITNYKPASDKKPHNNFMANVALKGANSQQQMMHQSGSQGQQSSQQFQPTPQRSDAHGRNEQISHSEKVHRRQQGRSLTIPPSNDRLSKLSSSLPPMTDKQTQLQKQNRSLSMMISGNNGGQPSEPQQRFQQGANKLLEETITNNMRIPLVLPYQHNNSVPVNNTVGLRGISNLANETQNFLKGHSLNDTFKSGSFGHKSSLPTKLSEQQQLHIQQQKILTSSQLSHYNQPPQLLDVKMKPLQHQSAPIDTQGQSWLVEQKQTDKILVQQQATTTDNSLDRKKAAQKSSNLYDLNSSNLSNIGAHVMTPPSNRHVQLTASLEQFQSSMQGMQVLDPVQNGAILFNDMNNRSDYQTVNNNTQFEIKSDQILTRQGGRDGQRDFGAFSGKGLKAFMPQSDGQQFAPRTAEANQQRMLVSGPGTHGYDNQSAQQTLYQPKFRVENRRARPIIIKNATGDNGNKFFSQQAQIQSSQKQNRRQVLSQGGQILGSIPYPSQSQMEQSSILSPTTNENNKQPTFDGDTTKDQYNFTFFKERSEPPDEAEIQQQTKELPKAPKIFKVSRPKNNGFNFLNTSVDNSQSNSNQDDYNQQAYHQQRNRTIEQVASIPLEESKPKQAGFSTPNQKLTNLNQSAEQQRKAIQSIQQYTNQQTQEPGSEKRNPQLRLQSTAATTNQSRRSTSMPLGQENRAVVQRPQIINQSEQTEENQQYVRHRQFLKAQVVVVDDPPPAESRSCVPQQHILPPPGDYAAGQQQQQQAPFIGKTSVLKKMSNISLRY